VNEARATPPDPAGPAVPLAAAEVGPASATASPTTALPGVADAGLDAPGAVPAPARRGLVERWLPPLCLVLSGASLAWAYSLQSRLKASEYELTRRHDEALLQVVEARTVAKQAEALTRDMAGKLSLVEARVSESSLQRTQLEDLMQSLSRSRDENVLADIEAALRVAQQHAALTGSVDPLLSTLKQSEERLARVQQPRLERVRRAVLADMDRVRSTGGVDLTALTLRVDEISRQVDELPLYAAHDSASTNAARMGRAVSMTKPPAPAASVPGSAASAPSPTAQAWLADAKSIGTHVWSEVRQLVRVTRLDHPEAALLAPEQAVFLRDNLRLRLLSARLSLLSRQYDVAQSDLKQAQALIDRYFDKSSRRVAAASELLSQTAKQARSVELPRPTATLAAIAAATAGR
jgi:uroporphyrin-III C-methyltransferase